MEIILLLMMDNETFSSNTIMTKTDISLLMKKMEEILGKLEPSGEFTFSGIASELPVIPGLFIKERNGGGLIPISLPIQNDVLANDIISQCEKAPFGHNFDTLIDEKVRKTWQISPDRVVIKHPEWEAKLDALVKTTVAQKLGCAQVPITAHLYKMLLYESEGHFLKHQDTEKEKGMFATMVVQLPSFHEGGELVVFDGDSNEIVHTMGQQSGMAPYNCHFAVHYADSHHKVLPIKSGYRLVLIYSICWPTDKVGPIPTDKYLTYKTNDPSMLLSNELQNWNLEDDDFMICAMKHQYTKSSLSQLGVESLKGIDREYIHTLLKANSRLPNEKQLAFYIVQQQLVIESFADGYCEDDKYLDWTENDRQITTVAWYTVDGHEMKTKLHFKFEVKDVLQPKEKFDMQDWGKCIKKEQEGYTGNAGPERTTTYGRYIVVLWKRSSDVDMKLKHIGVVAALEAIDAMGDMRKTREFLVKSCFPQLSEETECSPSLLGLQRRFRVKDDKPDLAKVMANILIRFKDIELNNTFLQMIRGNYLDSKTLLELIFSVDWPFVENSVSNLKMNVDDLLDLVDELIKDVEKTRTSPLSYLLLSRIAQYFGDVNIKCYDYSIRDSGSYIGLINLILELPWVSVEEYAKVIYEKVNSEGLLFTLYILLGQEDFQYKPISCLICQNIVNWSNNLGTKNPDPNQLQSALNMLYICSEHAFRKRSSIPHYICGTIVQFCLDQALGGNVIDFRQYVSSFCLNVASLVTDPVIFSSLVRFIRTSFCNYYTSNNDTIFLPIVEKHISFLDQIIKRGEVNDYKRMIHAKFSAKIEVERFLHGPSESFTLNGFGSVYEARKFAKKFGGTFPHYSAVMTAAGTGKHSYVTIKKTPDWLVPFNQCFNNAVKEKKDLLILFNQTPRPVKRPAPSDDDDDDDCIIID